MDPLGIQPESLDTYLAESCDRSMPRKSYHGGKKPVHWWTEELSELRKKSFAARRLFQRTRKRRGPDACRELEQASREAMKALRIAIKKSQEDCWKKLCQSVENDPWGLPYRLVMKRLTTKRPIPGISLPGRLQEIIYGLFPSHRFCRLANPRRFCCYRRSYRVRTGGFNPHSATGQSIWTKWCS